MTLQPFPWNSLPDDYQAQQVKQRQQGQRQPSKHGRQGKQGEHDVQQQQQRQPANDGVTATHEGRAGEGAAASACGVRAEDVGPGQRREEDALGQLLCVLCSCPLAPSEVQALRATAAGTVPPARTGLPVTDGHHQLETEAAPAAALAADADDAGPSGRASASEGCRTCKQAAAATAGMLDTSSPSERLPLESATCRSCVVQIIAPIRAQLLAVTSADAGVGSNAAVQALVLRTGGNGQGDAALLGALPPIVGERLTRILQRV